MDAMRLFTVAQVAEMWGISPDWVRDRIKDGSLQACDLGTGGRRKLRVAESAMAAFMDRAKVKG